MDRLCGEGRYAPVGAACGPCPSNAMCIELFPVPLPLPGFYPLSLTEFAACVPVTACVGVDVDAVGTLYRALLSDSARNATAQSLVTSLLRLFSGPGLSSNTWVEDRANTRGTQPSAVSPPVSTALLKLSLATTSTPSR